MITPLVQSASERLVEATRQKRLDGGLSYASEACQYASIADHAFHARASK